MFHGLLYRLVTIHYSLLTVRCIHQLSRSTRLSLLDATFLIDEIDEVLKAKIYTLAHGRVSALSRALRHNVNI